MTERAAHLVDHVFPDVPVRQWVLSLPPRIRYLLAWHHDLCKAVVADVLAAIEPGVTRLLARRGFGDDGDQSDGFVEATPLLAGLAAASVQGVVALGRAPGTRPQRLGDAPEAMTARAHGACHAQWQGFDLHAGLLVPAGDRDRLERVCRYTLRPPVTDERLRIGADGQVEDRWRIARTLDLFCGDGPC